MQQSQCKSSNSLIKKKISKGLYLQWKGHLVQAKASLLFLLLLGVSSSEEESLSIWLCTTLLAQLPYTFCFGLFWNWRHFDEGWIYTHVTLRMRQFTWSSSSLKVGRNMGWISNDQLVFTVDKILVFRETEIHSMKENK